MDDHQNRMRRMPYCPKCQNQVDKLHPKSHIVPKALIFDGLDDSGAEALLLASTEERGVKRCRTGTYSSIVCTDCEKSFNTMDDALIAGVRAFAKASPSSDGQRTDVLGIDPVSFKQGILGCLYRAHLSTDLAYTLVDLGAYAEEVRLYINGESATAPADMDVFVIHKTGVGAYDAFSYEPQEQFGAQVQILYIPPIIAVVKIDSRPFGNGFDDIVLAANRPVQAIHFNEPIPFECEATSKLLEVRGNEIDRAAQKINRSPKGSS